MEKIVLAHFQATDGTGVWEVGPDGLWVNGQFYAFTETAHIVCRAEQGNSYTSTKLVEEEDDFALWTALAVYQETHSVDLAGLTIWALGDTTVSVQTERHDTPGTIQLSVGGLRRGDEGDEGDEGDVNLRYREDGLNLQVTAVQHFATVALGAVKAYRAAHEAQSVSGGSSGAPESDSPRPQRTCRRRIKEPTSGR